MKVFADELFGRPVPRVEEEPAKRAEMMWCVLADANGQEDIYLAEVAKAEAGETILDLYNNYVIVQLYADGRAVLEEMRWSDDDEAVLGPPARIEMTVAQVKQLLLDWLAAKKQWRAEKAAQGTADATDSAMGIECPQHDLSAPDK